MSVKPLGQIAYEAHWSGIDQRCWTPWNELGEPTRHKWCSVAAAVVAAHEERKAKPAPIIGIGHGPCCTCQTCGKHYDGCICTFEAAI